MCIDLFEWAIACKPVAIREALTELPETPSIYLICVDFPATLPEPFRSILAKRTHQTLIYIGQASKSLYKRVWEEECLHKSPGTFFRSVGVMLGYVSPSGGKNFEFQKADKEAITKWILRHLSVAWNTTIDGAAIGSAEKALIGRMCPLLNITHNPQRLPLLLELRARSKRGIPV